MEPNAKKTAEVTTADEELLFVLSGKPDDDAANDASSSDGCAGVSLAQLQSAADPGDGASQLQGAADPAYAATRNRQNNASIFRDQSIKLFLFASLIAAVVISINRLVWQHYTNTASACLRTGEYDNAEKFFSKALKEATKFRGTDSRLATSLCNLAESKRMAAHYDEATQLHKEALRIRRDLFGDVHPYVADSLIGLAKCYDARLEPAAAEHLWRQAHQTRLRCFGPHHPAVASVLVFLSQHIRQRDVQESVSLAHKALQSALLSKDANLAYSLIDSAYWRPFGQRTEIDKKNLALFDRSDRSTYPLQAKLLTRIASDGEASEQERQRFLQEAVELWEKSIETGTGIGAFETNAFHETFVALARGTETTNPPSASAVSVSSSQPVILSDKRFEYHNECAAASFRHELELLRKAGLADSTLTARVYADLSACRSLAVSERKTYNDLALRLWQNFVSKNKELWRETRPQSFPNQNLGPWSQMNLDIEYTFEVRALLLAHPSHRPPAHTLQTVAREQIKFWEDLLGKSEPRLAVVLESLAHNFQNPERYEIVSRARRIWSSFLKKDISTAENYRWLIFAPWLDHQSILSDELPFWADIYSGPVSKPCAVAFGAIAQSGALPAAARLNACETAMRIWQQLGTSDYESIHECRRLLDIWDTTFPIPKAEKLNFKVRFLEKVCGKDSTDLASALKDWASDDTVPPAKSIEMLKQAATIWEQSGGWSPMVSEVSIWRDEHTLSEIGQTFLHWLLLDRKHADEILERQTAYYTKKFGASHPSLAKALTNAAGTDVFSGDRRLSLIKQAAQIWRECAMPYGRAALWHSEDIESTFKLWGEHDAKEALVASLERASFWEAALGSNHPRVARSWMDHALTAGISSTERESCLTRAAKIWQGMSKLTAEEWWSAFRCHRNLAVLRPPSSRWEVFRDLLCLSERVNGQESHETGLVLNEYAFAVEQAHLEAPKSIWSQSERLKCKELYKRAMTIWRKNFGKDPGGVDFAHVLPVKKTLWGLAKLSSDSEAEEHYKLALAVDEKSSLILGSSKTALRKLAVFYCHNGYFDKAHQLYKQRAVARPDDARAKSELDFFKAEVAQQEVSVSTGKVDFGPYMSSLQRQIRSHWEPPSLCGKIVIKFTLDKKGCISNVAVDSATPSMRYDRTGFCALQDAAPFAPLPPGSPEEVEIQFSFSRMVPGGE